MKLRVSEEKLDVPRRIIKQLSALVDPARESVFFNYMTDELHNSAGMHSEHLAEIHCRCMIVMKELLWLYDRLLTVPASYLDVYIRLHYYSFVKLYLKIEPRSLTRTNKGFNEKEVMKLCGFHLDVLIMFTRMKVMKAP